MRGACGGTRAARASARAGMGSRAIFGTALAALLLCGVSSAAPGGGGPTGEMTARDAGAGSDHGAAGLEEELRVGAAELAAVPAESRVLFAKVLGRLEGMRGELEELKAGKARSDERIARLEEESKDCEHEEEQEEQEEMEAEKTENRNSYYTNGTARHRKQAGVPACGPTSWAARTAAVMDACCPAAPGGHRRAQDRTTCPLPDTCPSAACAAAFVAYYDDCALELLGHAAELPLPQFASFYASCQELASGAGQMMLQPVAVQMFRVLVNTKGAAQAGAMFPGSGAGGDDGGAGQPLDPLAPVPPPPPDATGAEDDTTGVTQYHAECTSADVASCVPACNAEHHGYELLATIDGTDTKFSCNLAHGLYSWMGAASEGGYLGADAQSFFSAVVSGAVGSYILTLMEDVGMSTDLTIEPGQDVRISGDPGLAAAPSWGSGGFTVQERGSLALQNIALNPSAIIDLRGSASLSLASMVVRAAVLAAAESALSGAGSTLRLDVVTMQEFPDSALTGITTVRLDGSKTTEPQFFGVAPFFAVTFGPCTVSDGGRCVGRTRAARGLRSGRALLHHRRRRRWRAGPLHRL
eukprot:COSAG06_NODE_772_length_12432_cov_119.880159_8_plen_584_part_00